MIILINSTAPSISPPSHPNGMRYKVFFSFVLFSDLVCWLNVGLMDFRFNVQGYQRLTVCVRLHLCFFFFSSFCVKDYYAGTMPEQTLVWGKKALQHFQGVEIMIHEVTTYSLHPTSKIYRWYHVSVQLVKISAQPFCLMVFFLSFLQTSKPNVKQKKDSWKTGSRLWTNKQWDTSLSSPGCCSTIEPQCESITCCWQVDNVIQISRGFKSSTSNGFQWCDLPLYYAPYLQR